MTRRAKDAQTQQAQAASAQTEAQTLEAIATAVAELMARYSFDLGPYALNAWIDQWLARYPALWLRSAVIEALYQGRYKAVSVWQILDLWQRRGQSFQHFNREFERMVTGRSFQLLFPAEPTYSAAASLLALPQGRRAPASSAQPDLQQANPARLISVPTQDLPRALNRISTADSSPVIQPFKPASARLSLPDRRQLIQPRSLASAPVQRFIPIFDRSEFHTKLKSMAAALVKANAHSLTLTPAVTSSTPELVNRQPNDQLDDQLPGGQDSPAGDAATAMELPSPEAQADNN